jgi:hypothetical protein
MHPALDDVSRLLIKSGVTMTREAYIDVCWLGSPPDPWTVEDEAESSVSTGLVEVLTGGREMKVLIVVLAVLTVSTAAQAACVCECVNGHQQQLCESSIDIPAVCAPTICPIVSPSVAPIMTPMVPPIGTTSCHMAQVWNGYTYTWQRVCD